jgi:xanthine/uracil permease
MIKDIVLSLLFFIGVLLTIALGYGMNADFNNDKVLSLLFASGIILGSIFVIVYKELRK